MNIRVNRYRAEKIEVPAGTFQVDREMILDDAEGTFAWAASVEPDDASWILFVPKDGRGTPQLWIRSKVVVLEGQNSEHVYVPAAERAD